MRRATGSRSSSAIARRLSQPFLLHVAEHYAGALALCDGDLAAAEAAADRSQEWGRLLTGRDASGTYGDPDVRDPARAGPSRRAGAGRPAARRRRARAARGRPASSRSRRARDGRTTRAASSAGSSADGLGALRPSLWLASLAYLADACAALRTTRRRAEALYRGARRRTRAQRDDRPPGRLLRAPPTATSA